MSAETPPAGGSGAEGRAPGGPGEDGAPAVRAGDVHAAEGRAPGGPGKGTGSQPAAFPSRRLLLGIAAGVVLLDQVTKAMVHAWLPLYSSVTVIPGLLDFVYVRNTGAAFGFLNTVDIPFKQALMTAVGLFALGVLSLYASRVPPRQTVTRLGLAAIIGGAVGNLIDRVASGYVVDFVDFYWGSWHFWTFNAADAAITAGACCLIFDMVFLNAHVSETA